MVFAISLLSAAAHRSLLTAFATFIAGLWSVETLIGTLGIHIAFLVLVDLKERAYARLPMDLIMALVPAIGSVALMTLATGIVSGSLPDYGTYLNFLKQYNALSDYWGIPASEYFWGWTPVFVAFFLVVSTAVGRILNPQQPWLQLDDDTLYFRYVPMAGLLAVMASYYAGRSVDFTLALAKR